MAASCDRKESMLSIMRPRETAAHVVAAVDASRARDASVGGEIWVSLRNLGYNDRL